MAGIFNRAIFNDGIFNTAEGVAPAVVVQPSGGWFMRPVREVRKDEEELALAVERTEERTSVDAVVEPPPEAALPAPMEAVAQRVEAAAREAYLEEFARLMALEAARKAKNRRNAEMLLLMS